MSIKMRIFSTENEDFDTKMRNFNLMCNDCLKTLKMNIVVSFLLYLALLMTLVHIVICTVKSKTT